MSERTKTPADLRKMKKADLIEYALRLQETTTDDRTRLLEEAVEEKDDEIAELRRAVDDANEEARRYESEWEALETETEDLRCRVAELEEEEECRSTGRVVAVVAEATPYPTVTVELSNETFGSVAIGYTPGQEVQVA